MNRFNQTDRVVRSARYQLNSNTLTERQAEILLWLAEGKSQREIGLILVITYQAVEYHLRRVKKKLRAETPTEAVALCWVQGIMQIGGF